jgi:RNA polymerase sigma-70 factor (ECF subfamily)
MTTQLLSCDEEQFSVGDEVRAAQAGDRDAFGRLVGRYERTVYSVVYRRLNNHAEAQEACQEVFLQAMRKIGQLQEPECFGGWLRSIAVRTAINRALRRSPVTPTDTGAFEANCIEHETPLGTALIRERATQVRVGLRRLRAMDRDTLVAFYFDGRSLVEMSDQFQTPVGTIKRRLHVARKRLAKELEALAPA